MNLTLHFNILNKKSTKYKKNSSKDILWYQNFFERKLQVLKIILKVGSWNILSKPKNALRKFYSICSQFYKPPGNLQDIFITAAARESFSNRFLQFHTPNRAKFEELDLFCLLYWLDFGNLEMEQLEFQQSSMWKNKLLWSVCNTWEDRVLRDDKGQHSW